MNRPLVWAAATFVAGTYAAATGLCPGLFLPLLVCGLGLFSAFLVRDASLSRPVSVVLTTFAVAAVSWTARESELPGDALCRYAAAHPDRREWTVEGKVRLTNLEQVDPEYSQFLLDVDRLLVEKRTMAIEGGVIVRWAKPGGQLFAGERVRVRGRLSIALSHVNPRTSSYEDYLRARAIHTALWTRGPNAVERIAPGKWWSPVYWGSRLRVRQAQHFAEAAPESVLPFVLAIWLGHRSTISQDEYQSYVESGTAHILAVSGLHMGLVFVSVTFVLRMIIKGRRRRAVLTMGAVLMFALMSGARPSCLRAALMVSVYLLADMYEREPDPPTALSIAALAFLLWQPEMLFEGGAQLSFLSIASILLFAGPIRDLFRAAPLPDHALLSRIGLGGLAVSLSVQILPLPVALHCFHVFPVAAAATNLLVIPLATGVLWLCFLTSLCAMISASAALLFGHATAPFVWLISWIAGFVTSSPATHFNVTSPALPAVIAYYAVVAACVCALRSGHYRRIAVAGAAIFAVATVVLWRPLRPEPSVVILDVGNGDATFVRAPGGATLLVDGGDRSDTMDFGKRVVAPFLWSNHVSRLDCVALSHADRDHIGGLFYVLSHFPVNEVLLSGIRSGRPLENELLELCEDRGVRVRRLHAGDSFALGGVTLDVLHPPREWPRQSTVNDQSLVLRLNWGTTTLLLPGDIEARAEAAVSRAQCRADILKVPHHGSKTSSSEDFIAAVRPDHGIISTGGRRGREAADEAVMGRYRAYGVRLWRTDHLGGVSITFDGDVPQIRGTRPQRGYPCYAN